MNFRELWVRLIVNVIITSYSDEYFNWVKSYKKGYESFEDPSKESDDRAIDRFKTRAYLSLVRPIVEYATVAWSPIQIKGLTVSSLFNTAQHVLLTAITAAIVAFHLCLLIWTGLHCSHCSHCP